MNINLDVREGEWRYFTAKRTKRDASNFKKFFQNSTLNKSCGVTNF